MRRTGADELMVTAQVYDHAARLRSFEILPRRRIASCRRRRKPLPQRFHDRAIRESRSAPAVLCLPVADRAPRLEARQAVGAADIVADASPVRAAGRDVGAVKPADLAPRAGKALSPAAMRSAPWPMNSA